MTGGLGRGRIVGSHPTTGAPVIAWNDALYQSMCESFDAEHAAEVAAWTDNIQWFHFSTEDCVRWALWLDRVGRSSFWGVVLLSVCSVLISTWGSSLHGLPSIPAALFVGSFLGGMLGIVLLFFVGVALLMMLSVGSVGAAMGIGLWASGRARGAKEQDLAVRRTAEDVVSGMQQTHAPRPVEREGH